MIAVGGNTSAYAAGLQLSLWNTALLGFAGVQIGLLNQNGRLLIASERVGYNLVRETHQVFPEARADGLLIALVNIASRSVSLMIGGGNVTSDIHAGMQLGALNISSDIAGVQLGAVNIARDVDGVQIGVVNVARRLRGVQLGGIHIAYGSPIPFLVGMNVGW